jgi:hypothetical protein
VARHPDDPADRSQELVLPVRFDDADDATDATAPAEPGEGDLAVASGSSSSDQRQGLLLAVVLAGTVLAVGVAGAVLFQRLRRRRLTSPEATTS